MEPIHSVCVTFPSCFLNGNVVSCFRYIYVVRFPFLSTVFFSFKAHLKFTANLTLLKVVRVSVSFQP